MTRYTATTAPWLSQEIALSPWWDGKPDLDDKATVDRLAALLPEDAQHARANPSAPYVMRLNGRNGDVWEWSHQSRGGAIASALWFLWCTATDEKGRELMARAGKGSDYTT